MKPKPGAANVFCRPIPNSPYSIRLFPGAIIHREYCLDFVRTKTREPVNSPSDYQIWSAPETTTPWLGTVGMMRIRSLENSFGFSAVNTPAGTEKFVLRDGQTYVLRRPGHRDLRFKVPVRADGLETVQSARDEDRLQFPEYV